jgi:predicted transcriptional regulator
MVIKACEVGNKLIVTARGLIEEVRSDHEEGKVERTKRKDLVHDAMTWFRQGLAELEPFEVEVSATIDWKQLKVRHIHRARSISTKQHGCQAALQEGLGRAILSCRISGDVY